MENRKRLMIAVDKLATAGREVDWWRSGEEYELFFEGDIFSFQTIKALTEALEAIA